MTFLTFKNKRLILIIEFVLIFSWVQILSKTDSFYSVYILCSMFGVFSLVANYTQSYYLSNKQNIFIFACSLLFSFLILFANYQLFLPLKIYFFRALLVFVGSTILAWNALVFLCKKSLVENTTLRTNSRKNQVIFFFCIFLSFSVVYLSYLYFVAYPGILTTDSMDQLTQVMYGYTSNHHPFWQTIVISLFIKIGLVLFNNMNAAVALYSIFLALFMSTCFTYALFTLYQIGVSKKRLFICYLFYLLAPYNIAYSVTMWKDVVFGGAAILLVTSMFRIIRSVGTHKILNYILLAVSSIAFCLWRTNGWLAFLLSVIIFAIFLRKDYLNMVLILCAVLIFSWFLRSPVISSLNISQPDFVESLSIPVQQVANVISSDCDLTQEQEELLSKVIDIEEVPNIYLYYISDPIKNAIRRKDNVYFEEHKTEFFKLWLQLGIKYPGNYFEAWINQTKGYWNGGYEYWVCCTGVRYNYFNITHQPKDHLISKLINYYFNTVMYASLFQPIRSIGLHVWILFAFIITGIINRRRELFIAVPIVAVILTLLVATPVFSEFRYAYSLFTTLPFIVVISLNSSNNNIIKKEDNKNG